MRKSYYIAIVVITVAALILGFSISQINAEPDAEGKNQRIQSLTESKPPEIGLFNSENHKQFDSAKVSVKPSDMIAMDLSCLYRFKSFGLKDKQKYSGLKLRVRKDIDFKILRMHVPEDIDFKILRTP